MTFEASKILVPTPKNVYQIVAPPLNHQSDFNAPLKFGPKLNPPPRPYEHCFITSPPKIGS